MTPLGAVTAADPYPYYARLASEKPLHFDESLKLWVASNACFVEEVFRNPDFEVRPRAEPIPHALLGLRCGAVFGSLMRMTDGAKRCPLKSAAVDAINEGSAKECGRLAAEFASILKDRSGEASSLDVVRRLMFQLPTYTIGSCLGISPNELDATTVEVSTFVAGISPIASSEQRIVGDSAAEALSNRLVTLINSTLETGVLLKNFAAAGAVRSIESDIIVRNLVGFLFQTYDATAGLIGNSVRLLAQDAALQRGLLTNDASLRSFVWEVLRFDPPVQNTRRFATKDVRLGDSNIRAGEQVLLVLAAANRDPSRFPMPERFDVDRSGHRAFGFGLGTHECPGKPLALEITCAALRILLTSSFSFRAIPEAVTYRASANTRIPLF